MPDDWSEVALGDICRVVVDRRVSANVGSVPYVGLEHMPSGSPRVVQRGTTGGLVSQVVTFQPDDVLFGRLRPYLRKVAWADFAGVCSPEILVLRPAADRVLPGYLYALAASEPVIAWCVSASAGSRMPRTAASDLLVFRVPLPPLAEQRRIVDLIGAMDDCCDAYDREATTALVALATAREEWISWAATEPLAALCSIKSALVDPGDARYAHLPHIGIEAIESRTGHLFPTRSAAEDGVTSGKFLVVETDVVYSKIRPELRKATFPAMRALCSADAYPLTPAPGTDSGFLLEVLLSEEFSTVAIGRSGRTKMPKVNRQELLSIPVPRLPAGDQRSIGSRLGALRQLAEASRNARAAALVARRTLLDKLLSGSSSVTSSYDRFLDGAA